jgi:hypothetical protein
VWLSQFFSLCVSLGLPVWTENPLSSWLWKQPEWITSAALESVAAFRTDFCRWGTPWRKRTLFLTNIPTLKNTSVMCTCTEPHIVLRGSCHSKAWTSIAEPYPCGLADAVAAGVLLASGGCAECKRLDLEVCARAACVRAKRDR